MIATRRTLKRRLQHASNTCAALLQERDQARRERDDALAGLGYARDEIVALHAEALASDPSLWQSIACRASDEAESYARQLADAGITPNSTYRRDTSAA